MHGRKKTVRTEAEEAKRLREKAKLCEAYKAQMKFIFEKRHKGELDAELMQVTADILALHPDIVTCWCIRKEYLSQHSKSPTFVEDFLRRELLLTETCLKSNPKSYCTWYHRAWLMKESQFQLVKEELKLCDKYLEYDHRNLHCWDYRRFLIDNSDLVTNDQDLKFTKEKIVKDFSNYSSWHIRSGLLRDRLSAHFYEEMDMIKNAVFTDPNNQAVWMHYQYILKSELKDPCLLMFVYFEGDSLTLVFNQKVPSPATLDFSFQTKLQSRNLFPYEYNCSNPLNECYSKLWIVTSSEFLQSETVNVSAKEYLKIFDDKDVCAAKGVPMYPNYFDVETKPKSQEFRTFLIGEMEWIAELLELEPENKWVIFTLVLLMRLVDFVGFREKIERYVQSLLSLDTKRATFYKDLYSKYVMEWFLMSLNTEGPSSTAADLSNNNLTVICHAEYMCAFKEINLSGNFIRDVYFLSVLQHCQRIDLSKTGVKRVGQPLLSVLKNMKEIVLTDNPIVNPNAL